MMFLVLIIMKLKDGEMTKGKTGRWEQFGDNVVFTNIKIYLIFVVIII